jgi:hypothetical protein
MLFLILGTASATEISNVTSTDNENLMANCDELSLNNLKASESDFVINSENNEFNTLKSTNNDAALTLNETVSNSTPVKTELSISNAHYSKSGAVFKVILKDANGTSLEGKKVALKINGKTYSATTQSNGAAYVTTSALSKGSILQKLPLMEILNTLKVLFLKKLMCILQLRQVMLNQLTVMQLFILPYFIKIQMC